MGGGQKKGDRCVYTGGRGAMKGAIQEDLALTHGGRGRSRHETSKCGICTPSTSITRERRRARAGLRGAKSGPSTLTLKAQS